MPLFGERRSMLEVQNRALIKTARRRAERIDELERELQILRERAEQTDRANRELQVDAETGDEVDSADIIKGYEVGKGQYIEIQPEELEAIAIESKRTIEIDEFVPKKEIDELYLNSPYYLAPDGDLANRRSLLSARKAW